MNRFLIGILSVILLWSCSEHDDLDPVPQPSDIAQRTVIVYMSGENDLTTDQSDPGWSFLASDLNEMQIGSTLLNSRQHLIAFIDSVGSSNTPHLVEIAGGKSTEIHRYSSEFYASDPDKFREVLQWVVNNYPSQEYALVLWGHASGWILHSDTVAVSSSGASSRAYGLDRGWDQAGGSSRWMNITQMARALEGLPKLKYIFADCCNMMCAESAYELRHAADYLIGSPAEIPAEGAPYHELVPQFFSQSTTFYDDICRTYYDYFLDAYQSVAAYSPYNLSGYSVPLSAVDLNQMEQLAEATSSVVSTFAPYYPTELDLDELPFYFVADQRYSSDSPIMYDMKSIIRRFASESDYQRWLQIYNQAVVTQLVSRKWLTIFDVISRHFGTFPTDETQYGCLSMFVPQSNYSTAVEPHNTNIKSYQWYQHLNWSSYGW